MFIDSELKFGASTRTYIIRERPQINKQYLPTILQQQQQQNQNDSVNEKDDGDLNNSNSVYSLPESEAELDVIILHSDLSEAMIKSDDCFLSV